MARSHANVSCIQLGCSLLTFKNNKNFLCASQPWLFYFSWGILLNPAVLGRDPRTEIAVIDFFQPLMDDERRLMFHEKTIALLVLRASFYAKLEIITGRKRLQVQHFADVWTLLSKDEQSNSPWLTMPKGAANWLRWNFLNKIHFGWLPWIPSTTNLGLHPLEKLEFSEVGDKLENWYSERFNFRSKTKPTWAQKKT